jgi:hypothetical protein
MSILIAESSQSSTTQKLLCYCWVSSTEDSYPPALCPLTFLVDILCGLHATVSGVATKQGRCSHDECLRSKHQIKSTCHLAIAAQVVAAQVLRRNSAPGPSNPIAWKLPSDIVGRHDFATVPPRLPVSAQRCLPAMIRETETPEPLTGRDKVATQTGSMRRPQWSGIEWQNFQRHLGWWRDVKNDDGR